MRKLAFPLAVVAVLLTSLFSAPPASAACLRCTMKLRCVADDCWVEIVCVGANFGQVASVTCDAQWDSCEMSNDFCSWA